MLADARLAIFILRQSYVGRSAGRSAVASAAYRHSTKMRVSQEGRYADFRGKGDTIHSEVALPSDAPQWAQRVAGQGVFADAMTASGPDAVKYSERLWNFVEADDKRANGQLARETVLALPRELNVAENIELVRGFVAEQITARGYIADWAFHLPDHAQHNPHVHIMTTLRPLDEAGFGPKSVALRDADGNLVRKQSGQLVMKPFAGGKVELNQWRAAWQDHANVALARAGIERTIDHRSLKAQGIEAIVAGVHHGPGGHLDRRGFEGELRERDEQIRRGNLARFQADPALVLKDLSRQQSTFDDRDIARFIHRFTNSRDEFEGLRLRVGVLPELQVVQAEIHDPESNRVVQPARYTTSDTIEREARMGEAAVSRAADPSFEPDERVVRAALIAAEETQGFAYTDEQSAAIFHLLRPEGIGVLAGLAGAGKSTVLRAVGQVYEADGRRVVGAALAGKAAEGLEASSGIRSRTIASLERSWDNGTGHLDRGDILVLDEAGMVASAQMQRVIERVDNWGAKLVLVGDSRQLQPIEAGAAFRSLAEDIGYVELSQIRRQEVAWQAAASVQFGRGDARDALTTYEAEGRIVVHPDRATARLAVLDAWAPDWNASVDVVMLAHANRDVAALNVMARARIKQDGGLSGEASFVTARGMREFAVGDRVIFLENSRDLGIKNGTIGTVEVALPGKLSIVVDHLDKPVRIEQENYANVDHGYALTIHKTQGATVDKTHVLAAGSMDAQLAYVAMTRHREDATMHIAADSFKGIKTTEPASYIERLSRERLKDTTLAYASTEDYRLSLYNIREGVQVGSAADEAKGGGWLRRFIDIRGWAHPEEIAENLFGYGERLRSMLRSGRAEKLAIRVPGASQPQRNVPTVRPLPDALQGIAMRLDHVQVHSTRMGNQGSARRDALHMADHVLHDHRQAQRFREWAQDLGDIVSPSTVLAIGRDFDAVTADRHLADMAPQTRQSIEDNWVAVYAVSRAVDDVALLTMANALATGYRDDREQEAYERDPGFGAFPQEERVAIYVPTILPEFKIAIPAVSQWPETTEEAVRQLIRDDLGRKTIDESVLKTFGLVYRDPEAAWAKVKPMAERGDWETFAKTVRTDPASYGALRGGRNGLLVNNKERKQALDSFNHLSTHVRDYAEIYERVASIHAHEEGLWRRSNGRPLRPLSEPAQELLARLTEARHFDYKSDRDLDKRIDLDRDLKSPAWAELQNHATELNNRFPKGRGPERLLGLDETTRAAVERFASSISRAHETAERHIVRERYLARELIQREMGFNIER